jgi:phage shock protein E
MNRLRKLSALGILLALFAGTALAGNPPRSPVWIDVRTHSEFSAGHLEGAHNIPFDAIEKGVAQLKLEPDTPIYLYCGSGGRAERAKQSLERAGYTAVTNAGGLEDARRLAAPPVPAQP